MQLQDVVAEFDRLRDAGSRADAAELLDDALRRWPTDVALRFRRAELARDDRRWDDAVSLLTELLDDVGDEAPAQVHLRLAEAYRFRLDLTRAAEAAERGRERHPGYLTLHRIQADLSMSLDDWPAAIAVLESLPGEHGSRTPDWVFVRLAACHRGTGDLDRASRAVRQGRRLHPDSARLAREDAENAMAAQDWDVALQRWRHVEQTGGGLDPAARRRRDRARDRRDAMTRHRDEVRRQQVLRRGVYTYRGAGVWARWPTRLPEHLRVTKAVGILPATHPTRFGRLREATGVRLQRARRTFVVWSGLKAGPTVFFAASDGDVAFLDPAAEVLTRRIARLDDVARQVDLRTRWARHVPSPQFSIEPAADAGSGAVLLTEEIVGGRHLTSFDLDGQVEVVGRLIDAYAALAAHEATPPSGDALEGVLDDSVLNACRPGLRRLLVDQPWVEQAHSWPLVPCASDAGAQNIVVTPDGRPVMIDCMPLRRLVFFHDPIVAIARFRASPQLRRALLDGAFDAHLVRWFDAAGVAVEVGSDLRRWLVAVVMLWRARMLAPPTEPERSRELARRTAIVHALVDGDRTPDDLRPRSVDEARRGLVIPPSGGHG